MDHVIRGRLALQDAVDVAFAVQDADHFQAVALYQIKDAHILKPLDRPDAQACERGISQKLRRAAAGHLDQLLDRLFDGIQKPERRVGRILLDQIPAILPDDVVVGARANDGNHGRVRALCLAAICCASPLSSFQNSRVNGMSSPPARPSSNKASSRASSSACCASRNSERKYSLTLP